MNEFDRQGGAPGFPDAVWMERQRRLLAIEKKLVELGLCLDDLIELIEARQNGSY